ncbi:MAG: damage-inducible protein DinB [Acidobacteria bacterium]|nr:damage-inducible protein DinB [Acidobacteriota bacterium]
MGMLDGLLPQFDREMSTTRKVLERIPDEHLGWKPHLKSYSLGELASHIAGLPTWATDTLSAPMFDIGNGRSSVLLSSRSAVLATFDANASAARSALANSNDAALMTVWTLKRNGTPLFSMPKDAVLRSFVLSHLIHHRGQLSVYLRLLDVPVPSIYGPSADEPAF